MTGDNTNQLRYARAKLLEALAEVGQMVRRPGLPTTRRLQGLAKRLRNVDLMLDRYEKDRPVVGE